METYPVKALAAVLLLTSGLLCGSSGAQELNPSKDLPFRVRSIFAAKCSECHGRGLARPRAALYLDDIGSLAANRDLVVPFDVEASYLWHLVRDDDMPAKGAKAGPLNQKEKDIIRAWIASGAQTPTVSPSLAMPPPAMPPQASQPQTLVPQTAPAHDPPGSVVAAPAPVSPSMTTRLFGWLGRFHILAIHFPIALLAAAALAEFLAVLRLKQNPEPVVRYCVLLGAAGAVAAVALGWLHADVGGFGASAGLITLHRWLGTAAGLLAAGVAVVSEIESRRGRRTVRFRILLCTATVLVAAAAHFGGLLVHGQPFFEW